MTELHSQPTGWAAQSTQANAPPPPTFVCSIADATSESTVASCAPVSTFLELHGRLGFGLRRGILRRHTRKGGGVGVREYKGSGKGCLSFFDWFENSKYEYPFPIDNKYQVYGMKT